MVLVDLRAADGDGQDGDAGEYLRAGADDGAESVERHVLAAEPWQAGGPR
ncbi:hypothetical protein [Streptomyces sp. NPDC127066]